MKQRFLQVLGLDKHSDYVKNYFFATNTRSSISMSIIVIVIEIWMIVRLTRQWFMGILPKPFSYYMNNYYIYYFLLLTAGIVTLVYALLFIRGKTTCKWVGHLIRWGFSIMCIYFGIRISIGDYTKGEQMLTFLTMELFTVCLLVWRPVVGFTILTLSYAYYVYRISGIAPVSGAYSILHSLDELTPAECYDRLKAVNATSGLSDATKINLFTMWLSTLMFCISNYLKILSQARKDERLEEANRRLSDASIYDELTEIHNMFYFRTEAEKLISYVTTDRENIVFLYFDIENFKYFNQKYGFQEGNVLLKNVAKMIDEAFPGSLVSRLSDDHFVVLTKYEGSEEIIHDLSRHIHDYQRELHLSLKCGAFRPSAEEEAIDPGVACDRARFACNSIKNHYQLNYQQYDKNLEDRLRLKQYITNTLDEAIEAGYIKVFYQPIVSTQDEGIVSLEALARWQDPQYGLLSPGVFIDVLEEHRQIHKLDQFIIEQVCRDYRKAADEGLAFASVSLNFSRLDFELCDIVGSLQSMAEKYGVPQRFLDIEITESALTEQQGFLTVAMKRMRESGYKVWLDDFGSGYSSLNVLKDFQFDVLKIDMKFLSGFSQNEKTRPILSNIVSLTHQLDMVSLTEGVETREQFEFLRSIGCERAQGYLFSKPVPIEELRQKIAQGDLHISPDYAIRQKTD